MREVARYGGKMVFFSLGANHHDLALMDLGPHAADADPSAVGLYHLAFKVGDSLDELRAVKAELAASGVGWRASACPTTGFRSRFISSTPMASSSNFTLMPTRPCGVTIRRRSPISGR